MIEDEQSARTWIENFPGCDAYAQTRLVRLIELLTVENANQNLVSESSLGHAWQRHIADSMQLLLHVPRETISTWLDLGTGAGFPGLVIAILQPDLQVVMVESRAKRAAWLDRASAALGLTNGKIILSRLELLETKTFSVISARAFAPLDRLLKLASRFSTAETQWLLPKGRTAAHELHELTGWRHTFHVEQSLTDREAGLIVGRLSGKLGQSR